MKYERIYTLEDFRTDVNLIGKEKFALLLDDHYPDFNYAGYWAIKYMDNGDHYVAMVDDCLDHIARIKGYDFDEIHMDTQA